MAKTGVFFSLVAAVGAAGVLVRVRVRSELLRINLYCKVRGNFVF